MVSACGMFRMSVLVLVAVLVASDAIFDALAGDDDVALTAAAAAAAAVSAGAFSGVSGSGAASERRGERDIIRRSMASPLDFARAL